MRNHLFKQETMTLQQLAAYLPYRLQMPTPKGYNFDGHKYFQDTEHEIEGLKDGYVKFIGVPGFHPYRNFKPILRPLSQLTETIVHEGKEVKVSELLQDNGGRVNYYKDHIEHWIYKDVQILLQYHFNIFNLPESEFITKQATE